MSPEEISVLMALLSALNKMSGWPFGMMLFLIIVGPWLLALMIAYINKKRFEAVVKMYESNVKLVEDNEDLASDLKEVVIMNTQAMTHLGDLIKQNQFCPAQRVEKKTVGVAL